MKTRSAADADKPARRV